MISRAPERQQKAAESGSAASVNVANSDERAN
jgi:hypothetical protein